jgi:glucose-6-phosphate isomerase/transaldolase/glucose-6-phosphate isomerase
VFVSISLGAVAGETKTKLDALARPVIRFDRELHNRYDLGAEFFEWEFATAVAGWRLGINPFDQPNVQEAKTRRRNC